MTELSMQISGMTCGHCVKSVRDALSSVPGVEVEQEDGKKRDVTTSAAFRIDGDPAGAAVAVRDGRLVGVKEGQALVRAEYEGMASANELAINVTATLEIDEIKVTHPPSDH